MTRFRPFALLITGGLLAGFVMVDVRAQDAPASAATAAAHPVPMLDLRKQAPVQGNPQAGADKAAVCGACHGPQGIAIAPNFPNLAGQSPTYLYVQLKAFKEGQRSDPVMTGQAAPLSDEDMRDLAAYYASLPAKPAGKADASSRGGQLYLSGDPVKGIPPCQGCHGPVGQGPQPRWSSAPQPAWHTFPRLEGQSSIYVGKVLGDYKSGTRGGSTNGKVMQGVVESLDDTDIQALSTYINTL
ncbi:Cytochrome c553 [Dyella sp. OK004]|uniref:c-type cytochrome n=1 Tax=Dyella sp. OK004 TaxID=1855292 RepID=UPI0008DF6355|nr:c-type cytochrome [Dyella sp. OK004]SFS17266.1 Cytochrome c553 [Dyella sp. OK004]